MSLHNHKNNGRLSEHYAELINQAAQGEPLAPLNKQVSAVDPVMQEYEYDISSVPMIVSNDLVSDFNSVIKSLAPICFKVVRAMFGSDNAAFEQYLQKPGWVNELLGQFDVDVKDLLCRHDAIFENGVVKLVEINCGSSLGGWQHDCFTRLFEQQLEDFSVAKAWHLTRNQVVDNQFKAQIKAIKRKDRFKTACNLLFYIGSVDAVRLDRLKVFLQQSFAKVKDSEQSQLFFIDSLKRLQFADNGDVFLDGVKIDALLAPLVDGDAIDESLQMQLIASHVRGRLCYPDSAVFNLLNSKSLFALLHDAVDNPVLDDTERDFIRRHIPWTAKLDKAEAEYQGQSWDLKTLCLEFKDSLVLKKSLSLQGKDVFIGRFMSAERWQQVVEQHIGNDGWLVQQYCGADLVDGVTRQGQIATFDTVWGIFDFNNDYSGAFVRGCALAEDATGVINSANGAVEFFVYEQGKRQQKLRI